MWGFHCGYVNYGDLKSVYYNERLPAINVPTLVLVGDHDESDPSLAQAMHEKIAGSKLVIFPKAGHMTFVDQNAMFVEAVDGFLRAR
jgi:pimeloyl-ACP methyl ester carboxylesterase